MYVFVHVCVYILRTYVWCIYYVCICCNVQYVKYVCKYIMNVIITIMYMLYKIIFIGVTPNYNYKIIVNYCFVSFDVNLLWRHLIIVTGSAKTLHVCV